jgi:hypothetical protein
VKMSERPRWLQVVLDFVIDNVSILATLGTAAYVIFRQSNVATKLSTDDLIAAVLGVLALLALSELIERHRRLTVIDKTSRQTLELLEKRFTDRSSALAFFHKLPSLDDYVQGASQIDLCGTVLTSAVNRQLSNLREQLNQGAKIRILVVDPTSGALEMSEARSDEPTGTYYRGKLDTTFQDLFYLHQFQKKLGQGAKGSFEVRLIQYAPSFAIYSFDARQSTARSLIEIYPHVTGWGEAPVFDLMPGRDGKWYEYFVEQFEYMWNRANKWEYKPPISGG